LWPRVQPFLILGQNLNNVGRRPLDNGNKIQTLCAGPCVLHKLFSFVEFQKLWPTYDLTINITFDLCMQSTRTVWPTLFGLAPNVYSCAIMWKSSISILWEIWISVDAWQTHLMDNAQWKKASHKSSPWPYF